jgi:hypothetical protein
MPPYVRTTTFYEILYSIFYPNLLYDKILLTNILYFSTISYALMTKYISTFKYLLISARNRPSAVV